MMTKRMRKNLVILAATMSLAVGGLSVQAARIMYSDVAGHWAQSDIGSISDMQIMKGYSDGQFHPDAWVTREDFVSMTAKTLDLPVREAPKIPSLQNVSQNAWSFGNVNDPAWLSAYPQGVFRPENPVRRVEVLSGLAGTIDKPMATKEEAEQILSRYGDAAQIPDNARQQVATAIRYNLFAIEPTKTNMIQPMEPATRADVAAMLNRLAQNRDIAIVKNGKIMTGTGMGSGKPMAMAAAAPACPVTTPSPKAQITPVAAAPASSMATGNMPDAANMPNAQKTRAMGVNAASQGDGYTMTNPKGDWTKGIGTTPYRNSADTIDAARSPGIHPATGVQPLKVANLPTNSTFTGTLAKALYSEFNHPGDPVMLILDHTLMGADGKVIAPAGSRVLGRVTSVVPNNTTQHIAQLGIGFYEIVTPTGERLAIDATVASADGILHADSPQGVVYNPERSTAVLSREISASEGSWYGSKFGKMQVLETPLVTLGDAKPLQGITERTTPNIVLGVGDKLQLRTGPCPVGSSSSSSMSSPSSGQQQQPEETP